jgi:hypothetical protein
MPYLSDLRACGVAAVLIIALTGGMYLKGRSDGAKIEKAAWQAEKLTLSRDTQKLIAERTAENSKALADQRDLSKRKADDYEIKIEALDSKYRAARVAGGLRLPAAACRSATGREAIAAGPVKLNEASAEAVVFGAATERIPAVTEERLYALAKSADELAERLAALQAWIRESGLY